MIVFFLSNISQVVGSSFPLSFADTSTTDNFYTEVFFSKQFELLFLLSLSSPVSLLGLLHRFFLSFPMLYSIWNIHITYNTNTGPMRTQCGFVFVTVCCKCKKSMSLHWYLKQSFTSVHGKYRSP